MLYSSHILILSTYKCLALWMKAIPHSLIGYGYFSHDDIFIKNIHVLYTGVLTNFWQGVKKIKALGKSVTTANKVLGMRKDIKCINTFFGS